MEEKLALLINKDEEYLLYHLGKNLSQNLGASEPPMDKLISDARKWLKDNGRKLKERICNDEKVKKSVLNDKAESKLETALLIAELLSPIYTEPSSILIAAILTIKGIKNICDEKR